MTHQTIISVSPSNHNCGFAVLDMWEVKAIMPLNLKGRSFPEKIDCIKKKLANLVRDYQPELILIEKLDKRRNTVNTRLILAQIIGMVSAMGLPAKFITTDEAKMALCSRKAKPTWDDVVHDLLAMPRLTSVGVKNFLEKFSGSRTVGQFQIHFKIFPLNETRHYYWNSLTALVLGLGYFGQNGHISYEHTNNNAQTASSPDHGSGH